MHAVCEGVMTAGRCGPARNTCNNGRQRIRVKTPGDASRQENAATASISGIQTDKRSGQHHGSDWTSGRDPPE